MKRLKSMICKLTRGLRDGTRQSIGKADCKLCQGSGFITTVRRVMLPAVEPYDAEFAAVCRCRGGK
jgi:hypothetical protein